MYPTIDSTPGSVNAAPFDFARAVPRGGYAWWYIDALSDDERYALTIIAMLGSVFSPFYRRARARGEADPEDFSALNVALYGACGHRWALTERPRTQVQRATNTLTIGPDAVAWRDGTLAITIDERTAPWRTRIRGTVKVKPSAVASTLYPLDRDAHHHWQPIAPVAAVEVDLDAPSLRWSGRGYVDSNRGSTPLEQAFRRWHWSRLSVGPETWVNYDLYRADGKSHAIALAFGADAIGRPFTPPPLARLATTRWRVPRSARADTGITPQVRAHLEDTPFYARSVVATALLGHVAVGVHETVSLERFVQPWVQRLLPVRMRRA